MARTVIISRFSSGSHAGQKAPFDVRTVALRLGAVPIDLASYDSTSWWTRASSTLSAGWKLLRAAVHSRGTSALILQHPLGRLNDLMLVVLTRRVPTVTLIHDLEMLRWSKNSLRETHRLSSSRLLVAPTGAMEEFLQQKIPDVPIIDLERFDYIITDPPALADATAAPTRIIIAGSLNPVKAPYVYELEGLALPLEVYGPECAVDRLRPGVRYGGMLPTDRPVLEARDAFGLVWDGTSVDELAGPTGRYLQFNAPHKFSLYMALGVPVLVPSRSALAPLVQEHGLGLLIDDVRSAAVLASRVSPGRWSELLRNVEAYREGLVHGERTTAVLTQALERLGAAPSLAAAD